MEKKPKTHELWHELSPRAMTREELDKALENLQNTSTEQLKRVYASCYVRAWPHIEEEPIICDNCHELSSLVIMSYGSRDKNILEDYKRLADEFASLGYRAEVTCYCDDCVRKDKSLAPIVFSFQADWMNEPVLSYPNYEQYEDDDYKLALDFLKGVDSASALFDIHGPKRSRNYREIESGETEYGERIKRIVGPEPQSNTPPVDQRYKRRGKTGVWFFVDLDEDKPDNDEDHNDDGELPF